MCKNAWRKRLAPSRLLLVQVVLLTFATSVVQVAAQTSSEGAASTGQFIDTLSIQSDEAVAAANGAYDGLGDLIDIKPYFDLSGECRAFAMEFGVQGQTNSFSVIYDLAPGARRIAAAWTGRPMDSDPDRLSKASENVLEMFGVSVDQPAWIYWLGGINRVWAVYEAKDPSTDDHIVCNLFTFACSTFGSLEQQGISVQPTQTYLKVQSLVAATVTTLQNNVPVSNLSGAQSSEAHYKIVVPAGATNLVISISGGSGDCDLYVKRGQEASTSVWDYRPYLWGNNETVTVPSPASGDWYIMLRGYSSYSGVTLRASYTASSTYILSVRAENLEYLPGQTAVFVGSLKTGTGQPVSNYRIGVDCSIGMICTLGPYTDSSGNFRYEAQSLNSSEGVYLLTFYAGNTRTFCSVHIKNWFTMHISNPNDILQMGASSNISDFSLVYGAKIGTSIPQPTSQQMLDTANGIATFMAGTGQTALEDFVSNPFNDVAMMASGGCAVGIWTGVGTIPCAAVYAWTAKQAAKSTVYAAITQAIEMSGLTPDQKLFWKEVGKPGVKCAVGIAFLDPSQSAVELSAGASGWSCGTAVAGIVRHNNRDALRVAAVPSAQSQSKAAMSVILIPLDSAPVWNSEAVNWRVDYGNSWNKSGTVTKPGATRIRVHFSTISVESGYDHLRTDVGNDWSGSYSNVTSNEKAGNAMGLTLTSDGSVTGYFIIDRVEYQGTSSGVATKSGDLFGGQGPTVSSFSINNGTSSTASRNVTLNNTCTGSPSHYMASESSSLSGASWQTYSTAPGFTLSSGNGTKTVYFKVKNSAGVESAVVSDSITLSEPVWNSEAVNWRVDYGNSWNKSGTVTKPGATRIRLHFSTISVESGYDHLRTDVGNDWSGSYSNVTSNEKAGNAMGLTLTSDGSVTGYFIIDRVEYQGTSSGSATKSGALFGGQGPTVSLFSINNGASSTASRNVTLNNTCTGSPSHYMASESSSLSGASWQTYSTAPGFTLSSGNGTKTVYFKVKNSAGVESAVVSDSITLSEPVWYSEAVNWRVDYGNSWNKSGTVTKPGATRIRLHFSTISVESGYDHLRTDVGNDWSGSYSNVTSNEKAGNAMGLTLTSDGSVTGYFIIDRVEYQGTSSGSATKSGALFGG